MDVLLFFFFFLKSKFFKISKIDESQMSSPPFVSRLHLIFPLFKFIKQLFNLKSVCSKNVQQTKNKHKMLCWWLLYSRDIVSERLLINCWLIRCLSIVQGFTRNREKWHCASLFSNLVIVDFVLSFVYYLFKHPQILKQCPQRKLDTTVLHAAPWSGQGQITSTR